MTTIARRIERHLDRVAETVAQRVLSTDFRRFAKIPNKYVGTVTDRVDDTVAEQIKVPELFGQNLA